MKLLKYLCIGISALSILSCSDWKPVIILTRAEEGVKGSARSIEGCNIFEELTGCRELLDRFGGHEMAAGLSLKEENIEKLLM